MQFRILIFVALAAVLLQVSSTGTLVSATRGDDEMERIIGGQAASQGQFPWMAALYYYDQFICSSSIIGPRTILTAAHCVVVDGVTGGPEGYYVIANFRRSADEVLIDFESVIPHPNYNDSDENPVSNDIAILTTIDPIAFSDDVQPVCIARRDTPPEEYKNATAMGWGYTSRFRTQNNLPDELHFVEQKIVPTSSCNLDYDMQVDDTKICAGAFDGMCINDSGGPLVHLSADNPPIEIGVASYVHGFYFCANGSPGVWTRVSSYNDFILQNSVDGDAICRI